MVYLGVADVEYEDEFQTFYYNAETGKMQLNSPTGIKAYGKCTQEHPDEHLFISEVMMAPVIQKRKV